MTQDERQRLGTVLREHGRTGLRYVRDLAHPPERVWAAITASEHLSAWLPCDIVGERRAGAQVRLPFWQEVVDVHALTETTYDGEILEFDPPRRFVWTWGDDRLSFTLDATDGGTRLIFETWLGDAPVPAHRTAAGWHVCLGLLGELLDTGSAPGPARAETAELEAVYLEIVGDGG